MLETVSTLVCSKWVVVKGVSMDTVLHRTNKRKQHIATLSPQTTLGVHGHVSPGVTKQQ